MWIFIQLVSLIVSGFVLFMIYAFLGMILPYQAEVNDIKGEKEKFYVRSNGVHTDICFPIEGRFYNWWSFFNEDDFPNEDFEWVAIGWGDREFYIHTPTWDDLTFKRTFDSFFISTNGAMHVEMLRHEPLESESCAMVEAYPHEYINLGAYVVGSFKLSEYQPEIIGEFSYFGRDRFYEAKENYHLFDNCNSWTNRGLKIAGVRTAAWAIFPNTILFYLKQ